MLITESLAEPLQENVRPQKSEPEKNTPVAVSHHTVPPCGNILNDTTCLHAKKELVKKKNLKKMKKNKISSKEIKNRRFKTKLLEDAKKLKMIENRNRLLKRKSTSTDTGKTIIVKIDVEP